MRHASLALAAVLLTGCSQPLLVPEAGPGAPGYTTREAPPAPTVTLGGPLPDATAAGGAVDSVVLEDGRVLVTGWALLDEPVPRGELRVVLPAGLDTRIASVEVLPRPDVVAATGNQGLAYAGFALELDAGLQTAPAVCVLSTSAQGAFRLGGSDPALCP